MKNMNRILWGLVFIAAGVIFALNAFEVTNVEVFFDGWWTLFIIIPCGAGIFTEREKFGNFMGLCVGVLLLLSAQNVLDASIIWKILVPVIIIFIGLKMVFGGFFRRKKIKVISELEKDGKGAKNGTAVFSGLDMKPDGETFYGGAMTAVFGGVECDLRGAIIERDCVIDAVAVFGGVDIYLPENVNVKVNSVSIFGGTDHKQHINKDENSVTVYINSTSIFGGVEIR